MSEFKFLILGGDHIGPEVVDEAVKVLRALEAHPSVVKKGIKFNMDFDLLGGQSIEVILLGPATPPCSRER